MYEEKYLTSYRTAVMSITFIGGVMSGQPRRLVRAGAHRGKGQMFDLCRPPVLPVVTPGAACGPCGPSSRPESGIVAATAGRST
jgi:hypothetical protein